MSFSAQHLVPAPRSEVWDWHTRPGAISRLTPPFLPMTPQTEATSLADGTTIFRLPAGLKWVARHDLTRYHHNHRHCPHTCTRSFIAPGVCLSAASAHRGFIVLTVVEGRRLRRGNVRSHDRKKLHRARTRKSSHDRHDRRPWFCRTQLESPTNHSWTYCH